MIDCRSYGAELRLEAGGFVVSVSLVRYPGIATDIPTAPRSESGPKGRFQEKGRGCCYSFPTPKKLQATSARCDAEPPDASRNSAEPISFPKHSLHSLHLSSTHDNDENHIPHHICTPISDRFGSQWIWTCLNRRAWSRSCDHNHFNAQAWLGRRFTCSRWASIIDFWCRHIPSCILERPLNCCKRTCSPCREMNKSAPPP